MDNVIFKWLLNFPCIQIPLHFHYDNLSKEERQVLRSIMTRTDIVIMKADKELATVIMPRRVISTK